MKKIIDIVKEYFNRNKKYLFSKNIKHEMNGAVLINTNDGIFDFHGKMIDEVKEYSESKGYPIDKIIFVSSYDINISEWENLRMKSDSKINIVRENNKNIAIICMGSFVDLRK
jgi:hypothetical protein